MLQLQCELSIGKLFFDFVHEVKINSSWKNLTDTCTIKVPRNLKTKSGLYLKDYLWYEDEVVFKGGYQEYGISERFKGYVSAFSADTPIAEIECEDEMYKLKRTGKLNKSWANGDVDAILSWLKQQTNSTWAYDVLGDKLSIGAVKFEDLSAAKCLLKLKDDYGLVCFFRNGVLTVGKPYETDSSKLVKTRFEYGSNVISWRNLKWKNKDEVKLKVKVTNHLPDGKKKEITVGDADGEERTLNFYNRTEADLKKEAEALYARMKYDGYRGSITCFGEPLVKHGEVAVIKDWRMPERDGEYFIDAVETTHTVSSIRQEITLGPKV